VHFDQLERGQAISGRRRQAESESLEKCPSKPKIFDESEGKFYELNSINYQPSEEYHRKKTDHKGLKNFSRHQASQKLSARKSNQNSI